MGDILSNIKNGSNSFFSKYTKKQKIMMGVASFLIIAITTGSILYFSRTEYEVLYKDLDLKTSGEVVKNLDELKVQYKIQDQGTILVPKDDINKIKMDLSTKGVPSAKFSYEDMLNKNNMFMSDDEKEKAYNYALQNQLGSVIEQIPAVKKALVNLSVPQNTDFILEENKQKAKASVFLELKEGEKLDKQSIIGIASLVANSVEGLDAKNVTIHDQTGKMLNENDADESIESANQMDLQNKVKKDIEKNLEEFLAPVVGYGNFSVMASVKLNFDADTTETKEYKTPVEGEENGLVRSSQEETETVKDGQNGGVPGTATNTDQPAQYQQTENNSSDYNKSNKVVNYELNEMVRKVTKAKGQIQDITVSVVLNSKALEGKELSDEKKKEISKLVSTATGMDTKAVEVYAQSFNTDIADALKESSKDNKGSIPMWAIILLIIVVLMPLVGFGVYMIMRNKKKEEEAQLAQPATIEIPQEDLDELELDIKESGYKKSIESLVNKNPEIVSQLLKSWLDED